MNAQFPVALALSLILLREPSAYDDDLFTIVLDKSSTCRFAMMARLGLFHAIAISLEMRLSFPANNETIRAVFSSRFVPRPDNIL